MKEEIAKKWASALRSGKYDQGKYHLKIKNLESKKTTFCCLGVLCELYCEEHKDVAREEIGSCATLTNGVSSRSKGVNSLITFDGHDAELPQKVAEWADMKTSTGVLFDETEYECSLSGLNDCDGKTFGEIADVIEARFYYL